MTLKNRPRSLKSDQLFPFYQQCIHASLIRIHPLVQKITHGIEATPTTASGFAPKTICPLSSVGGDIIHLLTLIQLNQYGLLYKLRGQGYD